MNDYQKFYQRRGAVERHELNRHLYFSSQHQISPKEAQKDWSTRLQVPFYFSFESIYSVLKLTCQETCENNCAFPGPCVLPEEEIRRVLGEYAKDNQ